ncbi:MAG TPA: hypothetical protein VK137_04505, partial [Planctomycetaceae bacterium]|nr:hypothetical protein [Planctomycetaceae bacterium]
MSTEPVGTDRSFYAPGVLQAFANHLMQNVPHAVTAPKKLVGELASANRAWSNTGYSGQLHAPARLALEWMSRGCLEESNSRGYAD